MANIVLLFCLIIFSDDSIVIRIETVFSAILAMFQVYQIVSIYYERKLIETLEFYNTMVVNINKRIIELIKIASENQKQSSIEISNN